MGSATNSVKRLIALRLVAGSVLLACGQGALAAEPSTPKAAAVPSLRGEWLCFRGNPSLDARSTARGHIRTPHIAWTNFIGTLESWLVVAPATQSSSLALPNHESNASLNALADPRWQSLTGSGRGDFVPTAQTTFADVLPDEPGLEKLEFESGFSQPTVNGQWQDCVGRCFARHNGQWTQVWQSAPIKLLFQPLPLVGDFDGDGQPEVAILPFGELLLLAARTGKVKDHCHFTEGRSYGFFGVYDFDHDGRPEFLIQADFAKHVDVLGFREGKLKLLWQQAVELDISNPQKILRVGPKPVGDVDGDGRDEVLVCLFNDSGDQRWHIIVHDGLTGRVKADLPDEYLDGLVDLDGDRVEELLTTHTTGGAVPALGTIRVLSLKGGLPGLKWEQTNGHWQTWEPPLPMNVQSTATFGSRTVLIESGRAGARVVLQRRSPANPIRTELQVVRWNQNRFDVELAVAGDGLEGMALDARGALLVRCHHAPESSSEIVVHGGQATHLCTRRVGPSPGTVAVVWQRDATQPTLVAQGAGEELVLFEPPAPGRAAPRLRRLPGRGQCQQWPESIGPMIADLEGNGGRQLLFATAAPSGCARFVAAELDGRELWHHDFPTLPGTPPVWNTGGIIYWQAGHFTHPGRRDVLVTVRRSMMHSEETVLLSGRDGRLVWHRERQISNRGVGGTPFALADLDGDRLDDAVSFHPSIFYILRGATGKDLIARDATWDRVAAKPVYWGLPIAGDFEQTGKTSVFFGGRSMSGLVRANGELVWHDALDHGPSGWHAFGGFTGQGRREAIGVGYQDGVRCYDCATGKVRWHMPAPNSAPVTGSASADLDGDGKDEAIFAMGNQLVCLGTSRSSFTSEVSWRLDFPSQLGPPSIASLDSTDAAGIVVAGSDGFVYGVK